MRRHNNIYLSSASGHSCAGLRGRGRGRGGGGGLAIFFYKISDGEWGRFANLFILNICGNPNVMQPFFIGIEYV